MTDKQIIIDGVDVYKCGNAKRSIFGIDMECRLGGDCSQRPNCYYKQLKRKEQELEEVCKAFDIEYVIDKETGNLFGRCNKLYKKEKECEKLNEYSVGFARKCQKLELDVFHLKDKNYNLQRQLYQLKAEKEKLKKECEI